MKKLLNNRLFLQLAILIITLTTLCILKVTTHNDTVPVANTDNVLTALRTPEPTHVISTASIGAMGDLLIHSPILRAYYDTTSNSYDFGGIFKYVRPYISELDYAAIDLEGSLAGSNFSGYPLFRCPDNMIDSAKNSGFGLFLTANNHSNDGLQKGFTRTIDTLKQKNVDFIGTRGSVSDKKYIVKDLNGIRIGMVNYTYGTINNQGIASVNGIPLTAQTSPLINVFDYSKLDDFYSQQKNLISQLLNDNVHIIVYFMHWGSEYQTKENNFQQSIAQKLSDLGVDVIIGGHPHVVQPMDVIHSDVSSKDTICIYSVGNAVSNQRKALMNLKTGHTEDGVMFRCTFTKYSDDKVLVSSVDALPTWVNLYTLKGRRVYQIIPLDKQKDWKTSFDLSTESFTMAQKSYDRTMNIISSGLSKSQNTLKTNLSNTYPHIYKE